MHPVIITVSTPLLTYQAVRLVPKKAEGWVLRTTYSPSLGSNWSTIWLPWAFSVSCVSAGAFSVKTPASEPSSA